MKNIFITGTDTGVGKTVVSLLLMKYLFDQGSSPLYLKPFQTGCKDAYDVDSDAKFIYKNIDFLQGKDLSPSVVFCNKNPKAPLFAARDDNQTIDIEYLKNIVNEKKTSCSHLIIEGAGGLLVPVTDVHLVIDVIKLLEVRPLIVARSGLGTINHTLLSINMCYKMGINPLGVIMMNDQQNLTPPDMIEENRYAIKHYSGVKVFGVINQVDDFSKDLSQYYKIVEQCFM